MIVMKNQFATLLAAACLLLATPTPSLGQSPSTSQPNPQALYGVNSKWTNGIAPGYYPTCSPGSCVGLTLNVGSGTCFDTSGTRHAYAGGNLTMTNSATNYVFLSPADCSLNQNTTGYGANIPLATVTASGGNITAVTDDRTFFVGSQQGCPQSNGVNAQTVSYNIAAGDNGKLVTESGASLTATLPNPPPSGTWCVAIQNLNASNLTVSRNSLTINGGASDLTLMQYQLVVCRTDGSNYFCTRPLSGGTNVTLTQSSNTEAVNSTASGGGTSGPTFLGQHCSFIGSSALVTSYGCNSVFNVVANETIAVVCMYFTAGGGAGTIGVNDSTGLNLTWTKVTGASSFNNTSSRGAAMFTANSGVSTGTDTWNCTNGTNMSFSDISVVGMVGANASTPVDASNSSNSNALNHTFTLGTSPASSGDINIFFADYGTTATARGYFIQIFSDTSNAGWVGYTPLGTSVAFTNFMDFGGAFTAGAVDFQH